MARKKLSDEALVVNYFRNAPGDQARMILGIVEGIMKERAPAVAKSKTPKRPKTESQNSSESGKADMRTPV